MSSRKSKVTMQHSAQFEDEFESTLGRARQNPEFRAAYEDALERHSILDKLVRLRRALGLSQTAVATRMGVRQPTVSGFETEDSDPRLSTLQRYARAVQARLRLVLTIPSECDWVSASTMAYRSSSPKGSSSATLRNDGLAESWRTQKQQQGERWTVSA